MTPVGWVLLAAALVVLAVGAIIYRRSRTEDGQTGAILSFVLGADLLVFALLSG